MQKKEKPFFDKFAEEHPQTCLIESLKVDLKELECLTQEVMGTSAARHTALRLVKESLEENDVKEALKIINKLFDAEEKELNTIEVYCRECGDMTKVPLPEELGKDRYYAECKNRYYAECKRCGHEVFFREDDVNKALKE